MVDASTLSGPDAWDLLRRYQERYGIDDLLSPAMDLERTLHRRRARSRALHRRVLHLEEELREAREEAKAAQAEVEGTEQMGSLLVEEIVDRVRIEKKEGWSPEPILGFRMWVVRESGVFGAKTRWRRPKMSSSCLNRIPGEDLPHAYDRCGPPACGIYATKSLAVLRRELGVVDINGYMVGVVGMSGKVVEHDRGYRAAEAETIAVALSLSNRHLMTDDRNVIADLFTDPFQTVEAFGADGKAGRREADEYLERWKEECESWTWDPRSG